MKLKPTTILVILLALVLIYFIFVSKNFTEEEKLRICPDAWYENRMPPVDNPPPQYFVINGTRRNISEFDVDWIKENCEVNKPTPVY